MLRIIDELRTVRAAPKDKEGSATDNTEQKGESQSGEEGEKHQTFLAHKDSREGPAKAWGGIKDWTSCKVSIEGCCHYLANEKLSFPCHMSYVTLHSSPGRSPVDVILIGRLVHTWWDLPKSMYESISSQKPWNRIMTTPLQHHGRVWETL